MTTDSARLLQRLQALPDCRRLVIGFSGGVDSTVLLHLLAGLRSHLDTPLLALHINHQLQKTADAWQGHCRQVCAQLGVPCAVRRVDVAQGASLEGQARAARYAAFEEFLQPGDWLLLAHHADDQAETLLLRLLRGTGLRGLGGIPECRSLGRGQLLRPLLSWRRADLLQYARRAGLAWIEDPSNGDPDLDRSYLRTRLLPLLEQRWPGYRRPWLRAMAHCRDGERLSADLAALDLRRCALGETLTVEALLALADYRQRNLLRHWLRGRGVRVPDQVHLARICREVLPARDDGEPRVAWPGGEVRRYRGRLYGFAALPAPATAPVAGWAPGGTLRLPQGELALEPAERGGLRLPAGARLEIRFRQGGERCQPAGRSGSHPLKKLLQEYGVPPWERAGLPLLFLDGVLVAVADLWVCEGFACAPGEAGWRVVWSPLGGSDRGASGREV